MAAEGGDGEEGLSDGGMFGSGAVTPHPHSPHPPIYPASWLMSALSSAIGDLRTGLHAI